MLSPIKEAQNIKIKFHIKTNIYTYNTYQSYKRKKNNNNNSKKVTNKKKNKYENKSETIKMR